MQEVFDFLKKCKTYFIATIDDDQPRVRPFGTVNIYENKLYFQTAKSKAVSKQLKKNPRIEISAMNGDQWIRMQAVVVEDDRVEPKQKMLDNYPQLQSLYSATDGNTQVFYLKNATATISSFTSKPKVIKF